MSVLEQLRSAAGEADRACGLLESPTPETLERCSAALEAAATTAAGLQPHLPRLAGDPEVLAEAWRLRRTVSRAATLLSHAEAYHRHWRDLVGVLTAGYGPGGRPGESPQPGRISVRG